MSSPGSTAPVDHWHNDSIAFAGVVVLSDMEVAIVLVLSWDMLVVDVVFDKTFSRHRPLTIGTMTALLLLELSFSPIWRWLFFCSSSIKEFASLSTMQFGIALDWKHNVAI